MSPADRWFLGLGPHGFHRICYREWGGPANSQTVVCVHGLTRNSHDFDRLGKALEGQWRVICPDLPGRGGSDWLKDPAQYDFPRYLADMASLLARLNVDCVDWVGTSLGGLIGLFLAAQPNTPIRRLVLNDVGPVVPKAGLARLRQTAALPAPSFGDLGDAEVWFREAMATFGPIDESDWPVIARHGVRRTDGGRLALHFDPGILASLSAAPAEDVVLWPLWDRLTCPVLAIRGAESDFLTAELVAEMRGRGPGCSELVVEKTGHAPMLMAKAEIEAVAAWLGAAAV